MTTRVLDMRTKTVLAAMLSLVASSSWALPTDVKTLAQFDIGYTKCEKLHESMRGHRDAVYAGVWRQQLDPKLMAQLSATRKSVEYSSARKRALATIDHSDSPANTAKVEQQCQAVWSERQTTP